MPTSLSKYFPPLTVDSIYRHYLPAGGAISYVLFSAHCLAPTLISKFSQNYWHGITMAMWFNAHAGIGLYVYSRKHLSVLKPVPRIIYSVFSTTMFNFGTVLLFGAVFDVVPRSRWIRISFALLTSSCFLLIGRDYLSYIDNRPFVSDERN